MMEEIFNLANYSYNFHAIPYLIFGFIILFFGIFIFLKNPRSLVNVSYFLTCFFMFLWMVPNGISKLAIGNEQVFLFWFNFQKSLGVPFIAPSLYFLSVGWLNSQSQRKFILPAYLLMVPFAVMFWFSGIMATGRWLVGEFFGYPFYYGLANMQLPYAFLYGFCWFFLSLLCFLNIYRASLAKDLSLFERKRRKFFFYITLLAFLASSEWLPFYGIKFYPFGSLIIFVMLVCMAFYGILKYRLFDIKLVIKKAFFYSLGIALASGLITAVSFLSGWFSEKIPGFRFWFIPLAAGIIAFIVGNLFYQKSKQIEKAYKREKQSRIALNEMKKVLEIKVKARTRQLEELAQNLEEQVKERTKELQKRVEELEKFQKLVVGRELKMMALKKEIEKLKKEKKRIPLEAAGRVWGF